MQYIFNFQKEDNLPTRDRVAGPKVSSTQRSHCSSLIITSLSYTYTYMYYCKSGHFQVTKISLIPEDRGVNLWFLCINLFKIENSEIFPI